jgi:hypothetical protein
MSFQNFSAQPFVPFVKSSVTFVVKRARFNHRGLEGMHEGHKGLRLEAESF